MIEIGKPEVVERSGQDEWICRVAILLVHSNRYGWAHRLRGWTGPKLHQFGSREEAVAHAEAWVAEAPDARCAFVSG